MAKLDYYEAEDMFGEVSPFLGDADLEETNDLIDLESNEYDELEEEDEEVVEEEETDEEPSDDDMEEYDLDDDLDMCM